MSNSNNQRHNQHEQRIFRRGMQLLEQKQTTADRIEAFVCFSTIRESVELLPACAEARDQLLQEMSPDECASAMQQVRCALHDS